jgi:hypothetical protein
MISILLQTNCDFAVGSVITIAGLIGSNTPDETGKSVVGGYYDDWFDQTITIWLQTPGVLKLQVPTFLTSEQSSRTHPFAKLTPKISYALTLGLLSAMSKSMFCSSEALQGSRFLTSLHATPYVFFRFPIGP